MNINKSRTQLYLLIIQIGLIIFTCGGLTNWFRYGMSLESGFLFLLYLILTGILLIPAHLIGVIAKLRKKNPKIPNILNLIPTIALIIISFSLLKFITGNFIPFTKGHVSDGVHHLFINHKGEKIEYWVEFTNPFLEKHEEHLVLINNDEQHRIKIKAKQKAGGYVVGSDSDELILKGTNYLLHTEFEPWIDCFFLINPEALNVISNWMVNSKPIEKESNQRVDFTVKTPIDKVKVMRTESHP